MSAIHHAMLKYGVENFQFQVLYEFETEREAFNKEIELIAQFKTNMCKHGASYGYNLTDGGDGASGHSHSEEARQKMSDCRKGIVFSETTLEKMRQAKLGRKHTPEHIEKQRLASLDRKQSPSAIQKISAARTGANNPQAKLDEQKVREIKVMLANDKAVAIIAPLFGAARKTVSDIKHHKTWAHVEPTESDIANTNQILAKLGDAKNPIKLNKEKATQIRLLTSQGEDAKSIAKQFGVSPATIKDIQNNRYWRDDATTKNKITLAKLDEGQVKEIKRLLAEDKLSYSQIARKFGVAPGTINKIKRGLRWK